jgi:predicted transcriptional regulator
MVVIKILLANLVDPAEAVEKELVLAAEEAKEDMVIQGLVEAAVGRMLAEAAVKTAVVQLTQMEVLH